MTEVSTLIMYSILCHFCTIYIHTHTHTHTHTHIYYTHPTRETMTEVSALLMRPMVARSRGCVSNRSA
jgi:hypothetical protein